MAKAKLKCETNTDDMGDEVIESFSGEFGGIHDGHAKAAFEHGQWWVCCANCGAQWSVNDAVGPGSACGFFFEEVSEGDESCLDAAADAEEGEEAAVAKQEAVEGCYYGDANVCNGELWECGTCGEQFCDQHWHETDKGKNAECVGCERERKDASKDD